MAAEAQITANRLNAQQSTGPRRREGKAASRLNALRHGLTRQIEVATGEEKEAKDKFFAAIISSLAPEGAIEHQFAHAVAEDHWRGVMGDEPVRPYPRNVLATRSTCGWRASSIENNIFTLACSFKSVLADDIAERIKDDAGESHDQFTREPECPEVGKSLGAARVFVADQKRFQLMTIYEGRIHRTMTKNLQQLHELQAIRRAEDARQKELRTEALDEPRLLTQLAETEGVTCDIATEFPDPNGFVFSTVEITQSIRRLTRLKEARRAEASNPAARSAA